MTPRPLAFPPQRIVLALGALAVIIIIGYAGWAAYPLLEGPRLSVNDTAMAGTRTISGSTERVSFLSINGLATPLDEDGSFSVARAYPPGYTGLVIVARDRFGRERTVTRSFVTTPIPASPTTPLSKKHAEEEN